MKLNRPFPLTLHSATTAVDVFVGKMIKYVLSDSDYSQLSRLNLIEHQIQTGISSVNYPVISVSTNIALPICS